MYFTFNTNSMKLNGNLPDPIKWKQAHFHKLKPTIKHKLVEIMGVDLARSSTFYFKVNPYDTQNVRIIWLNPTSDWYDRLIVELHQPEDTIFKRRRKRIIINTSQPLATRLRYTRAPSLMFGIREIAD